MKQIINFLMLVMFVVIMNSCKPDNDFTTGPVQNRIEQLAGTWKLMSVTQVDLIATNNNFIDPSRPDVNLKQMDLTEAAPFRDITLTFSNDAANVPSTFTADYGNAPRIFRNTNGNWEVDDLTTPGQIRFINGTDTIYTKLGAVNNLSAGLLTLQRIKSQGVKPVIQYNYNFQKN